MIERGATVPCRRTRIFTTTADNQSKVEVHVLQGERELASANKSLARFELIGIPPAPKGTPQVEVAFDIDSNGIASVSAKDLATGLEQQIVVTPTSGLTPDEIERAIFESETYRDEDRQRIAARRAKSKLDRLLDNSQKTFKEFHQLLSPELQAEVQSVFGECRSASGGESLEEIDAALEKLEEVSKKLTEVALYDPS